jgi:hypothetical protein
MVFVHGLVRTQANGRKGWCAPVELGEAAPHYISFVVPVDEKCDFFSEYVCEVVTAGEGGKRRESHDLVRQGTDSFLLRLGELELWFAVRPGPKEERRAPYVGSLEHEDFRYLFTEIEPEQPEVLDRLYDREGAFVIGCEPFAHYAGAKRLAKAQ